MGQECGSIPQTRVLADVAVNLNYVSIQKSTFEQKEIPMKDKQVANKSTDTKTIKVTVNLTLWVLIAATSLMLGLAGAPFSLVYGFI
jgi:hypothetical protein